MASLSIFEGRVSGARRSDLAGMFVEDLRSYHRQKNSFRVVPQEPAHRSSVDDSIINDSRNKKQHNLNSNNNVVNANHGPATTIKGRVRPSRSGGGMGVRPKSTLSLPDLESGNKELMIIPPLQESCRVIRSESTMPACLPMVARCILLSGSDEDSEGSALDRRMEELIVAGDITQLESFIQDQHASAGGAPVLVNTRLEGLSSPQGADLTDCTPLGLAIMRNDFRLVSALIRLGADVTMAPCLHRDVTSGGSVQDDVMTPFHLAVTRFCAVEVIRALLDVGNNSQDKSEHSTTCASTENSKKIEEKRKSTNSDNDVDPRKMGELGISLIPPALFFPVLQYIAKCPDVKLARRIIEALRPDEKLTQYINVKDDYGKSALHVACKEGTAEAVKLLIEKGIDINGRDKTRKTALMYAARRGNADQTVKDLLSRDADVTAIDSSGRSALHYAVMNEQLTTTELLLKAGADPATPDLSKSSPIDHAVSNISKNSSAASGRVGASEVKILTLLVESTQARLELSETSFRTACTSLIERYSDCPEVSTFTSLKRLCSDNPELIKTPDPSTGETLLHYACRYAYASSIVQWLVSSQMSGCDLNCPGNEGYPPLLLAVRIGATDSAAILLRAGANVNVTSLHEPVWTGLWLALCRGNGELARELIAAGANAKVEMAIKYLRIANARQCKQAVTADDPLMLLASINAGKVNAFEFALHKSDLTTAHKLMTSLKRSQYAQPEASEKRRLALELLSKCMRNIADKNEADCRLEEEIKNWISTGKLISH